VVDQRKKRWSELTRAQRRMILAGAAVQLVLQAATLWDLRRSAEELRGAKRWWTAAGWRPEAAALSVLGRRGDADRVERPLRLAAARR
jgi:hypothetical protein